MQSPESIEVRTTARESPALAAPAFDWLSRFVFVDSDTEIDEDTHVHSAACSCQFRGV
jgi:hypothetical protein